MLRCSCRTEIYSMPGHLPLPSVPPPTSEQQCDGKRASRSCVCVYFCDVSVLRLELLVGYSKSPQSTVGNWCLNAVRWFCRFSSSDRSLGSKSQHQMCNTVIEKTIEQSQYSKMVHEKFLASVDEGPSIMSWILPSESPFAAPRWWSPLIRRQHRSLLAVEFSASGMV